MDLSNSKRVLRTVSYVTTRLTREERQRFGDRPGRAIEKTRLLRQLKLSPSDLERIERMAAGPLDDEALATRDALRNSIHLIREFNDAQARGLTLTALATKAAVIPASALESIANFIAQDRASSFLSWLAKSFSERIRAAPIGQLYLERIEMYPIGTEQGELIFTVPLAPLETATISHKEWSTSSATYESIVQDYYESYSERGVAEKSDFSMSTENESKHSSALEFGATYAARYTNISIGTQLGLKNMTDERASVKQSAERSREITEKASARARQEHKITAKLETKKGTQDSSFRTVTNPHTDRALRIDYFRMMRKWRTDLFRYDLRLTFDIAVPNPGARLWARYQRVALLDSQAAQTFVFPLTPEQILEGNWHGFQAQYGVSLDAPPPNLVHFTVTRDIKTDGGEVIEFVAPPGYMVEEKIRCILSYWGNFASEPLLNISDANWKNTRIKHPGSGSGDGWYEFDVHAFGGDDKRSVQIIAGANTTLVATFYVTGKRRTETMRAWQQKCWTLLHDAALTAYNYKLARLQAERDDLWRKLIGKDTLTLRRMERDEIMRATLLWIIGPEFDAAPDGVGEIVDTLMKFENNELVGPTAPPEGARRLLPNQWATAAGFGEFVKFVHHAIEWESILYFLYPYFWGSETLARDKLLFEHPDPQHRDFLRAGYARIVVPVRPGFEHDFTQLLDQGLFSGPQTSPYVTAAEDIAAYARTNFTGVPPANPEKHARPLLYPEQRATWQTMLKAIAAIEKYHDDHGSYPATLNALPNAPFVDAWGNALVYSFPGSGNDYDLVSLGADGQVGGEGLDADISAAAGASLVASWFDYTPTSGIDIELHAKLEVV